MAEIVYQPSIINFQYFKAYSPIPVNFNLEEVRPFFNVAEELWLVPLLGNALYDELLDQVQRNEVTELNSTLLIKLYPYLSFCICYESLAFIGYHFSETGITAGFSQNSRSVNINDMNYISSTLRNQIELMKKILRKFLNDNAELYPKYCPDNTPCDCECNSDNELYWNFYFGNGAFNKYDWERHLLGCMFKKKKPNPYTQLFSTPRRPIDIR